MNAYLKLFETKKLVLIMSLPLNRPELCRAAFAAGADAVKVHMNVVHHASGTHFGSLREERPAFEEMLSSAPGPMGIVLGGSLPNAEKDAREVLSLPFAFHSLYAHHVPAWFLFNGTPLQAACDCTYAPWEIRRMRAALGAELVEASIVPPDEYGQPLSMRDLIRYRTVAEETDVPVVVPTQRAIRCEDVKNLMAAGVKGLMIGAVVTGREESTIVRAVESFRKAIDEA
ncbi:MAG: hypothetical protein II912_04510 [Clostridia bacterium]|nr:hypothetical protein [Clostridia bacterium]MBR5752140.1 hypothetical protein [Clostridia bacterium]